MNRPAKDRLREYFRLPPRRSKKELVKQHDHHNHSNHKEKNNDIDESEKAIKKEEIIATKQFSSKQKSSFSSSVNSSNGDGSLGGSKNKKINLNKSVEPIANVKAKHGSVGSADGHVNLIRDGGRVNDDVKTISEIKNKLKPKQIEYEKTQAAKDHDKVIKSFFENNTSMDPLINTYSNTTSSTYYYNETDRDMDTDTASSIYTDRDSVYEKKPLCEKIDSKYYRSKPIMKNNLYKTLDNSGSILGSDLSSRKGSTSTIERDLEIIDLLERERSMDIQEMMANERRAEFIASSNVSRQSSTVGRRKLPELDYTKMSSNVNTKLLNLKEAIVHQSTNRFSPTIGMRDCSFDDAHSVNLSRKSSRSSHANRDSFSGLAHDLETPVTDHRIIDQRLNRQRSSNSSRGSAASRRYSGNEFRELGFTDNL